MKKVQKLSLLVAVGLLAAMVALFGCSSGGSSSSSASSSSASASSSASESSSASASTAASSSSSASADGDYTLIEEGTLTVGTSPDFPPFENLENGEFVGLDIDIAKAIAKELGLEVEFKSMQFDTILPAVSAGGQVDFGISGISVDPERAKQVDFSDSYCVDDQAVAVMKDSGITTANAAEELNKEGVVIAVQSGTTAEDYVLENYPNATAQPYGNSTDAFAAMQAGQANAVCVNSTVAKSMLEEAYQDAEIVATAATGEEYAIAISQDNPALTAAVNDALAKLSASGELDKILNAWL